MAPCEFARRRAGVRNIEEVIVTGRHHAQGYSAEEAHGWSFSGFDDDALTQLRWAFHASITFEAHDVVADLGFSRSQLLLEYAPNVAAVHAVDLDPERIAEAREETEALGLTHVQFSRGACTGDVLPARTFSKVLSVFSLHLVEPPGQCQAVAAFARLLGDGGELHVAGIMECLDSESVARYRKRAALEAPIEAAFAQAYPPKLGDLIAAGEACGLSLLEFGGISPVLGWARFARLGSGEGVSTGGASNAR